MNDVILDIPITWGILAAIWLLIQFWTWVAIPMRIRDAGGSSMSVAIFLFAALIIPWPLMWPITWLQLRSM